MEQNNELQEMEQSNELQEIWKDIEGYEGLYQISTFGNVKSLKYKRTRKERLLKPDTSHLGYGRVTLSKDGIATRYSVYRLVALAFIPNDDPINKVQVGHKDEDCTNNHVDNLEWVTSKENCNMPLHRERIRQAQMGEKNSFYNKHHTEEAKDKIREGLKTRVITQETREKISAANTGRKASEETKQKIREATYNYREKHPEWHKKKVCCVETGEIFNSVKEAENHVGACKGKISACCKGKIDKIKGYHWKYVE